MWLALSYMNGVEAFLEKETNQLGSRICHVKLCIPFILNGAAQMC